jgi:hypothetical protein
VVLEFLSVARRCSTTSRTRRAARRRKKVPAPDGAWLVVTVQAAGERKRRERDREGPNEAVHRVAP